MLQVLHMYMLFTLFICCCLFVLLYLMLYRYYIPGKRIVY